MLIFFKNAIYSFIVCQAKVPKTPEANLIVTGCCAGVEYQAFNISHKKATRRWLSINQHFSFTLTYFAFAGFVAVFL